MTVSNWYFSNKKNDIIISENVPKVLKLDVSEKQSFCPFVRDYQFVIMVRSF